MPYQHQIQPDFLINFLLSLRHLVLHDDHRLLHDDHRLLHAQRVHVLLTYMYIYEIISEHHMQIFILSSI